MLKRLSTVAVLSAVTIALGAAWCATTTPAQACAARIRVQANDVGGVIQDRNEQPVTVKSTVYLLDDHDVIASQETNDGTFLFEGVANGTYKVLVEVSDGRSGSEEVTVTFGPSPLVVVTVN